MIHDIRQHIEAALAKPLPEDGQAGYADVFDPWNDVIKGISGSYASKSDDLMIAALEAVRDRKTLDFIQAQGFAAEFSLYVLAGHGLTNYGTSPRHPWPDENIGDLWNALIKKWKAYAKIVWGPDIEPPHKPDQGSK